MTGHYSHTGLGPSHPAEGEALTRTDAPMPLYAVMRLTSWGSLEIQGFSSLKVVDRAYDGSMGFLPVFDNLAAAEKHSEDGRYQIAALQLVREPAP